MVSKIANIDRRILYVLLLAVIAFALVSPVGLAITVSPESQKLYNAIQAVPDGSYVYLGFEFDASAIPELMPAAKIAIRQLMDKNCKIVAGSMWQMGGDMAAQAFDAIMPDYPGKQYGVDWVNLGYRPGQAIVLDQANQSIAQAFTNVDFGSKNQLSSLPMMANFQSLKDAKFILIFETGTPGTAEYIKTTTGPLNIPLGVSCVAVDAPGVMPYIASGQVVGGFLGMKGAAEYETLMKKPGSATAGMDAQSFAHALIILFIILGNVGYLIERKSK